MGTWPPTIQHRPRSARYSTPLSAGVYVVGDEREAPFWLSTERADWPTDFVACRNGLLDVETRELIPHTPQFFSVNALPFDFDPDAPEPERWYEFLESIWPEDEEAERCLQEIFGLAVTADTSYQKIFGVIGPRRSGKGTMAHVLTGLLGRANVASPTMASLGTQFGLWPLIDKRLAIVPDARLNGRDASKAVEHLLSISGEDMLTVDRKYQSHWHGKLSARLLILTNELPKFSDASGALASRCVILTLKESFLGREQLDLKDRLLEELPGILNWSLRSEPPRRRRRFQASVFRRGPIKRRS